MASRAARCAASPSRDSSLADSDALPGAGDARGGASAGAAAAMAAAAMAHAQRTCSARTRLMCSPVARCESDVIEASMAGADAFH